MMDCLFIVTLYTIYITVWLGVMIYAVAKMHVQTHTRTHTLALADAASNLIKFRREIFTLRGLTCVTLVYMSAVRDSLGRARACVCINVSYK